MVKALRCRLHFWNENYNSIYVYKQFSILYATGEFDKNGMIISWPMDITVTPKACYKTSKVSDETQQASSFTTISFKSHSKQSPSLLINFRSSAKAKIVINLTKKGKIPLAKCVSDENQQSSLICYHQIQFFAFS